MIKNIDKVKMFEMRVNGCTYEEIGKAFCITRERALQILKNTISKEMSRENRIGNMIEPIKDNEMIKEISLKLRKKSERDYIIFKFLITNGMGISDVLKLKVINVRDSNKNIKDKFIISEIKTGKRKIINIDCEFKAILDEYCRNKKDDNFLFQGKNKKYEHISRRTLEQILKAVGKELGINDLNSHVLKKTYEYKQLIKKF